MATVHLEVEKKYLADESYELPSLTALVRGNGNGNGNGGPFAEGETARQRLTATYFDTDDLLLAAAGLTLRRRTGGGDAGWHPKAPPAPGARAGGQPPPRRAPRQGPHALQKKGRGLPRAAAAP